MRLRLVPKAELTSEQLTELNRRLQQSIEIEGECGPVQAWRAYQQHLYAFLTVDTNTPIAIAEASGRPVTKPGWWVANEFRNQGYGNELIDLLAQHLKGDGVTTIGPIPIQTPQGTYDAYSTRLVLRLRRYFP